MGLNVGMLVCFLLSDCMFDTCGKSRFHIYARYAKFGYHNIKRRKHWCDNIDVLYFQTVSFVWFPNAPISGAKWYR